MQAIHDNEGETMARFRSTTTHPKASWLRCMFAIAKSDIKAAHNEAWGSADDVPEEVPQGFNIADWDSAHNALSAEDQANLAVMMSTHPSRGTSSHEAEEILSQV